MAANKYGTVAHGKRVGVLTVKVAWLVSYSAVRLVTRSLLCSLSRIIASLMRLRSLRVARFLGAGVCLSCRESNPRTQQRGRPATHVMRVRFESRALSAHTPTLPIASGQLVALVPRASPSCRAPRPRVPARPDQTGHLATCSPCTSVCQCLPAHYIHAGLVCPSRVYSYDLTFNAR